MNGRLSEFLKCKAYFDVYFQELKTMDREQAISIICCLVDALAGVYRIDTMQLWAEMHKNARKIYDEMGPFEGPVRGM